MQGFQLKSFFFAVAVFAAFSSGAFLFWVRRDVIGIDPDIVLLGLLFFSVALSTVLTYQSSKTARYAHRLASSYARDLFESSQELFSELYQSSPVPYLQVSESGKIESVNYAATQLFGVHEDGLVGNNVFESLQSENPQQVALIRSYLRSGVLVKDEEVQVLSVRGEHKWVMLSILSFKDKSRKRKGFVTLVDITKQKQIDRVKTEFVSLASHQLRTPISAMKWNLELLIMKHGDALLDSQKEYLNKVAESAERMDALVGDFLNVSKLELGTFAVEPEEINLGLFLDEVLREHEEKIVQKQLSIDASYRDTALLLRTDKRLLRMILSNIISNAVKYTRERGVVTISLEVTEKKFFVHVADSGMGIPFDEQDKIFGKVFRASNAKKEVSDGTGLGLYIVREAARVLHGDVTFVSEENVGTTFTVTLPRW